MSEKITGLTEQASGTIADGDLFVEVDVSDTTMAPTGTNKKYSWASLKTDLTTFFNGVYAIATRTVSAGTGLTGGGDLSANRTIGLDSASVTSLGLADTAVQPADLGNSAALDVGTSAGTVAAGDDSRFGESVAPLPHAATHTDGTDDIQDATAAQKGLATAAQITKLDGIEAGADVTDTANVAAAGAVMDTGAQAVAGVKTFSSSPVVPTPTTDFQAATKEYVDNNALTNPMTTAGDIIIGGVSGGPDRLGIGTDGHVLTVVSGTPAWAPPSGGSVSSVTEIFTSSGTWTKPTGAVKVHAYWIGGGGGGGSGRKDIDAIRCGGGGGAPGCTMEMHFDPASLGATESVVIGAGGAGGAAQTADSTNGNAGDAGGDTLFNSIPALGGNGGGAGTSANGLAGALRTNGCIIGSSASNSGAGAAANTAGLGGATPTVLNHVAPTGGGAGGGQTAANSTTSNGGNGGGMLPAVIGTLPGGTGGDAGTTNVGSPGVSQSGGSWCGTGGGGGARWSAGGDGGLYGAGGGGGGAGQNGSNNSGAGGDGAPGVLVITTYF